MRADKIVEETGNKSDMSTKTLIKQQREAKDMIKNIVNMQEYVITFVETEMNNKRGDAK